MKIDERRAALLRLHHGQRFEKALHRHDQQHPTAGSGAQAETDARLCNAIQHHQVSLFRNLRRRTQRHRTREANQGLDSREAGGIGGIDKSQVGRFVPRVGSAANISICAKNCLRSSCTLLDCHPEQSEGPWFLPAVADDDRAGENQYPSRGSGWLAVRCPLMKRMPRPRRSSVGTGPSPTPLTRAFSTRALVVLCVQ